MALIKCNNCGNMVSDKAEKCLKCGAPIEKGATYSNDRMSEDTINKRKSKGLVALLCGLLFIALAIGAFFLLKGADGGNSQQSVNKQDSIPAIEAVSNSNEPEAEPAVVEEPSSNAGLTFRTFTKKDYDETNKATYQIPLSNNEVSKKLKGLGFELIDKKTESRPDYTGENYDLITVYTYSKTVNGYATTVLLESDYTEIHFPNLKDVEEFKNTVRACRLKETKDGFMDNEDIYWAGTDVSIKGTIVTLNYKWEP